MPLPMHLSIRGFPLVVMLSARQVVLLTQGRLALCAGRCLYLNPSCLIVTVRLHGAATAVRVDKWGPSQQQPKSVNPLDTKHHGHERCQNGRQ